MLFHAVRNSVPLKRPEIAAELPWDSADVEFRGRFGETIRTLISFNSHLNSGKEER